MSNRIKNGKKYLVIGKKVKSFLAIFWKSTCNNTQIRSGNREFLKERMDAERVKAAPMKGWGLRR
jgi:hypothetical protein